MHIRSKRRVKKYGKIRSKGKLLNKRELGTQKELLAMHYLEKQGMKILERNFRCRTGEIDLIARDGTCLVFVEVKYRTTDRYGSPLEAVSARKQQTIRKVAEVYLLTRRQTDCEVRFDVVGICGDDFRHIKDAF